MKKILLSFTALLTLLAMGVCKGADVPNNAHRNLFDVIREKNKHRSCVINFPNEQITDVNFIEDPQAQFHHRDLHRIPAYLNLENNLIQVIPENWTMRNLKTLKLVENRLEALPENVDLPRLSELDLANNRIQVIPDALELNALARLNLSNNDIQHINPQRLLEQFPKLKTIDLSGNMNLDARLIDDLRDEAKKVGRNLEVIADDVAVGIGIKG